MLWLIYFYEKSYTPISVCVVWSRPCSLVRAQFCRMYVQAPPTYLNTVYITQTSFSVLWLCLGYLGSRECLTLTPFPVLCQSPSHSLELSHIQAPPGKLTWLICCLTKCPIPYNHICVYPMLFLPHTLWILCGQVSLMHGYICKAHYTLLGIVSKTEKNILPEHCKTDLLLQFIIKQISVLTHIVRHFLSLQGFLQFSDLPLYFFPY